MTKGRLENYEESVQALKLAEEEGGIEFVPLKEQSQVELAANILLQKSELDLSEELLSAHLAPVLDDARHVVTVDALRKVVKFDKLVRLEVCEDHNHHVRLQEFLLIVAKKEFGACDRVQSRKLIGT